jgi:hypothetical protein
MNPKPSRPLPGPRRRYDGTGPPAPDHDERLAAEIERNAPLRQQFNASPGRPLKRRPPPGPVGQAMAQEVYSTTPGFRWPSIKAAAEALDLTTSRVGVVLNNSREKRAKGHWLTRRKPRWAADDDERAEMERLAAFKVRVPPGGAVGAAVLAARRWVAERQRASEVTQ